MDVTTRDQAANLLLKAARTHGIHMDRDEVQQLLQDSEHGVSLAEWATMHLTSDNLLTADELALYSELDKSGQVDKLAALHDLAEVQAVTEDDLRTAIEELRQSTEAISRQSETLRQQHDALSRLESKQAETSARRRTLEASRRSKSDSERKRVAAEVEESSHSLAFRISDIEDQRKEAGSNLDVTLDEVFQSDDKLLASLQKLGWELHQPDPEEAQQADKLREVCMRLIKITVEGIRARLDTVYLDALVNAERSGRVKPATEGEVKALQEEVESLYSEILPVAQMAVEQQHLEPALKQITARNGQSINRTSSSLTYILECLDYLLARLERFRERIDGHKSHQAAAATLISMAKKEMSTEVSLAKKQVVPILPASPVRKRANTGGLRSRRRSSGVQEEAPLDVLFESLSLPSSVYEEVNGEDQINALAKVLQERSQKCDEVALGAQESFEMAAIAQLDDMRLAVQLLRDSVLAESPYSKTRLIDPDIESSVLVLGQEVDKVHQKLAFIESLRIDGRSEKKDQFLQRWAR